jgi:3-methyladenine DNA glycosylase AlkD
MKRSNASYQNEVTRIIRHHAELERAARAAKDKNSSLKFLPVRVPILKSIVKQGFPFYSLSPDQILSVWDHIWKQSPYFEVMNAGLIYYGQQKSSVAPNVWHTISTWAAKLENWAHCDELAKIYSYLLPKRHDEVLRQLRLWNLATNEWLRRISLVSLIHYTGKNAVFLPASEMFPLIENCMSDNRYYVQRAVGWVLREMSSEYPVETDEFISARVNALSSAAFTNAVSRFSEMRRMKLTALRRQGSDGQ